MFIQAFICGKKKGVPSSSPRDWVKPGKYQEYRQTLKEPAVGDTVRNASLSRIPQWLLFVTDLSWGGVRPTSSRGDESEKGPLKEP